MTTQAQQFDTTTIDIGNPVALEAMPFLPPSFGVTAPTTLPQPRPKKQRNYNPNKARDERKRELEYLRNEVEELGFKLEHLQAIKADRALRGDETLGSQLASGLPLLENPGPNHFVWEQTCARQLNCRLRSERENIHLKLLLKKQIQVAKSMEKLLNKRTKLTAAETSGSNNKRTIRVHVSLEDNVVEDVIVYEELNMGVEVSYQEVETMFASNELLPVTAPMRNVQMLDGENSMSLKIYDNKVMPFSMHATGEAWRCPWNHFSPNRCGFRIENTDDSIVEQFGMEMSDTKTKTAAKFFVQQRLRRYVEKDRIVIVWQSHIEPLEFSNKKLAGIRYREKGYVIIKPHNVSEASDDEAYTLVQTCYVITPDLPNQRLSDNNKTGALTEFVLSATVDNISTSTDMIENLLVDQELQQRSCI
ncbi:hypothetical protein BBP00_00008416 [Phytophthora kernoviae]|uniref:M96 mating-specific protein family n=1 Tax=Phytophthora kernoviae TaxID=325452 RepID=A0A3F2RHH9_9STRA|nr:hypothetical protein BBP00_00008416 [Phytophthora kernoviae]